MSSSPSSTSRDDSQAGRWRSDAFLARHRRWVVAAILLLSALVRVGYYVETADGLCGTSERYVNSDMHFFDRWARTINSGDPLGRRPMHPLHDWHLRIAELHFEETGRERSPSLEASARGLWNEWYGGSRFHQEPLYPYAVALTYRLPGEGVHAVYLLQMLLGVLSNLLIYLVARRSFSETVGVVAAALAIAYGPLLFYETVLLRSSAITFAGLLAVWLTQSALDGGSSRRHILAGLCAGLATLLKSTLALLGLGAVLIVLWRERHRPRVALSRAGLLAAGMGLCLLPVALRNVAVGAPVTSLSSVAAVTFLGANFHGNDPALGFQLRVDEAAIILGRTGGRLAPTVGETLRTHPRAGSWPALCLRKLGAVWHGFEIPNNVNFYVCRTQSRLLRLLPGSFAWIAPLALAGLLAAVWRRRGTAMLYLLVGAHLLPLLVFYVLARFRVPLVAALIPFAAAALVWFVGWIMEGRHRAAAFLAAVAVLAALWSTSSQGPRAGTDIRVADVAAVVQHWVQPEWKRAHASGEPEAAGPAFIDALRLEPPWIEEILEDRRRPGLADEPYLRLFHELHLAAAMAFAQAGRQDEARRLRDRGQEIGRHLRDVAGGAPTP